MVVESFSQVILFAGSVGQAHDHFVERIQWLLRLDPPRSMVVVDWPSRPRNRDEFFEALALALNTHPSSIAAEMAERLAYHNLVLLHPCIRARFVDDALVKYYCEWLPEALEQTSADKHVKCVQPIEFEAESLAVSLLSWLRLRRRSPSARSDAERLISRLKTAGRPVLRTMRLRNLSNLTPEDLRDFCDLCDLDEAQRTWLLEQVAGRRASLPADVFKALDDFLPDARSIT
jgi:hypothetical protein